VYALAMNDMGTLLVSGGTEKVGCAISSCFTLKASIEAHLQVGTCDPQFHLGFAFIRSNVLTFQLSSCAINLVFDVLGFAHVCPYFSVFG
jgi:hypothetical protein